MTEPRDQTPEPSEHEAEPNEGDPMRALLKRSLGGGAAQDDAPDLLRGVQRKIRQRSKGKFYGDGWSTSQSKINYLLVALVMLVLVGIVYFALGPTGFTR